MAASSKSLSPAPARAEHGSGHSSPAPKSPVIMTPGRKIRELMAQFDSDSDSNSNSNSDNDDNGAVHERPQRSPHSSKPQSGDAAAKPEQQSAKSQNKGHFQFRITQSSDDDSDDDDVVYRPRGRMAARLLQQEGDFIDLQQTYSNIVAEDTVSRTEETRDRLSPRAASIRDKLQSDSDMDDHANTDEAPINHAEQHHDEVVPIGRQERRLKPLSDASASNDGSEADAGDDDDDNTGRLLTQRLRPTRKATKAALEEMNRQTQRMSRNMQLTHNAITKKKLTLNGFLSRLNNGTTIDEPVEHVPTSSAQETDNEPVHKDTPPTSPTKDISASYAKSMIVMPTFGESYRLKAQNEPVEIATTSDAPVTTQGTRTTQTTEESRKPNPPKQSVPFRPSKRNLRVNLSRQQIRNQQAIDSDDDLEIVTDPAKARRIAIFENMPMRKRQQDIELSSSIQRLRALAQVQPSSQNTQVPSQTMKQLEQDLWRRAREQANRERKERLNDLRAKGIVIETPEEISRFEDDMEDLLEKARMEAKEISKQEKDKTKGGTDDRASHAGDDDEYDESEEDNDEDDDEHDEDGESEAEDDGEDEEEAEQDEDKIEGDNESEENEGRKTLQAGRWNDENEAEDMVLRHGGSDDDSHQKREQFQTELPMDDKESHSRPAVDEEGQPVQGKQGQSSPRSPYRRMSRTAYIIPDDDDDEDTRQEEPDNQAKHQSLTEGLDTNEGAPSLDLGIAGQKNAELSLSQAFMNTLAEDQPPKVAQSGQESLSLTKKMSDANSSTRPADISKPLVIESPVIETAKDQRQHLQAPKDVPNLHLPLAAAADNDSSAGRSVSKFSVAPTPTQDKGFMYSPYSRRLSIQKARSAEQTAASKTKQPPTSSVDTGKKRLLLRRGLKATGTKNPMPEMPKGPPIESSVFNVMKANARTREKTKAHFDKQRSEAKDIVDEAAEESDDEYAGLGGRSDDSEGEEDEEDRKIINDDDNAVVNEAELAALNAQDLRNKDEAAVQKLYHDITTGALRRKRGHGGENDVDLSDSDDERRAALRKAKRREFAKIRRALLLADNNIGQIAEDPKKKAFLQTLEEHIMEDSDAGLDVDKEWDGLDDSNGSTESTVVSTLSQQDRPSTGTLQRLPSKKKQTVHNPTSSIEVKNAISSLLGEPDTPSVELPDDEDEDEEESIHQSPFENERLSADSESDDELAEPVIRASKKHERPTQHKPTMPAQNLSSQGNFVNRWSLRRTASINAAMSMSASKPAFNQENRASIFKRTPLSKGPRTLLVTPDSQRAKPHAPHSDYSGNAVDAGKASNGEEHANNNYYSASRKRQRESELEHASGAPNKPRKLTAVIAAARIGAGLRKWVGDKGFET